MISVNRRAEEICKNTLLADPEISKIYGKTKVFQGFVKPDMLTSCREYLYLRRIDSVSLDRGCVDGTPTDKLRRVRIQVDVFDLSYTNMVIRSELVRAVITKSFPAAIDGDTYGVTTIGTTTWNVASIDVILTESEV